MSSDDYDRYKYSVTCHTEDAAVLHCLRSLCQYAEQSSKPQIGWGGTGEKDWRANDGTFKLRFSSPDYRQRFIDEANRLLAGHWSVLSTSDKDPASPQRAR